MAWLLCIGGGLAVPGYSPGAPEADAQQADSPQIRRIYVPMDRIGELGEEYPELRSYSRDEFDALVRRARAASGPAGFQLQSSHYEANIERGQLQGTAQLVIPGKPDAATLLVWPVGNWTIRAARWSTSDAKFGYAGHGQFGLVVPPGLSHALTIEWSAPGRTTAAGRRFEFDVPPSLQADWSLDLPAGAIPSAAGGSVSGPRPGDHGGDTQRWQIRWSPAAHVNLLIATGEGVTPFPPLITYERDIEADLSAEAAEITARFRVTASQQPVRELEFAAAPELELYGWTGLPIHEVQAVESRVRLILAEPLSGTEQITVRGLAPGSSRGSWRFPKLELLNAVSVGGSARLRTDPSFILTGVQSTRAVEFQPTGSTDRGEWIARDFGAHDTFEVSLLRAHKLLVARVHSSIELGSRIQAETTATWNALSGDTSSVELRVPPGWSVQAVDGVPASLVPRWSIRQLEGSSILTLHFNRPIYGDTPATAQIRLTGPDAASTSPGTTIAIPRFQPIGADVIEEDVTIKPDPLWAAELVNASQITRLGALYPPARLTSDSSLRFRFDGPAASGSMLVTRKPSEFTARMDTSVQVSGAWVEVDYQFDLEWQAAPSDFADVRWTGLFGESPHWELPAGYEATRLAVEGDADTGEVWRIRFPRKAGRRVRLVARWFTKTASALNVPLPVVPDAATSTGNVVMSNSPELLVTSRADGLVPESVTASARRRSVPADARSLGWRYEQATPSLSIDVASNSALAPKTPWIVHAKLFSRLDGFGRSLHSMRYEVRDGIGAPVEIRLPDGAEVQRISSGGATILENAPGIVRLAGPSDVARWVIWLDYSMAGTRLRRFGRCEFPLPQLNLPIAHFSWEFEVPAEQQIVAWSNQLSSVPPNLQSTWAQRLFGPLQRTTNRGLFRFWELASWQGWWEQTQSDSPDEYEVRLEQSINEFVRSARTRDRTWWQFCGHLNRFSEQRLVVDFVALERAGIKLTDEASLRDSDVHDVFGLGSHGELSLIRAEHGLVLTTRSESVNLGQPRSTGLRRLRSDAGVASAIDEALLQGVDSSGRFVRFGAGELLVDFESVDRNRFGATSMVRSGVARFEASGQPVIVALTFVQAHLVNELTALIAVLAVGAAIARKSRPDRITLMVASAIAAIGMALAVTVPAALSPPATALGWGTMLVILLWSRLPALNLASPKLQDSSQRERLLRIGFAGLLVAFICVGADAAFGTTPLQRGRSDVDDLVVFVPFDSAHPETRDSGSRVLVPRSTYSRLLELARSTAGPDNVILFRSTALSGRMSQDRLDLAVDVELEIVGDAAQFAVFVPLSGLVIRSASLDGNPCVVESESAGVKLQCRGSGRHRLHLDTVVTVDQTESSGSLDLTVPPAPRYSLDLLSPSVVTWTLDSAISEDQRSDGLEQWLHAELATPGRLAGRWSRIPAPAERLRSDSACLMTWRGAAAGLDWRTAVHVDAGAVRRLVFDVDPRLSLKRVSAPGLTDSWLVANGSPPQWVLEFDRPIDRSIVVAFDCVLGGATGPELAVPDIRLAGARSGVRLAAVRGDGKSRLTLADSSGSGAAQADTFASLWREPLERPPEIFVNLNAASPPVIRREPVAEATRLHMNSKLRATPGRTDVQTRIATDATIRGIWHEFALPEGFVVNQVRTSAGTNWKLWKSPESLGRVTSLGMFSNLPIVGPAILTVPGSASPPDRIIWTGGAAGDSAITIDIDGWILREDRPRRLPLVRPVSDVNLDGTVQIWRARELAIDTTVIRGLRPEPLSVPNPGTGDLVGEQQLQIESADCAADWTVRLRPPKLATTVATRVLVDDAGAEWISVLDCRVTEGAIQKIQVDAPSTLPANVQLSGEGIQRRQVVAQGDRQLWTVSLDAPRWDSYRLMWRTRLNPDSVGNLKIPIISPLDTAEEQQLLMVLNATSQEVRIAGVEHQESIPSDTFGKWFPEPITKSVAGAFRVESTDPQIEVRAVHRGPNGLDQVVVFQRHQSWIESSGSIWFDSTFRIRSRSSGELEFRMPDKSYAYEIRKNGRIVRPSRRDDGAMIVYLSEDDRLSELAMRWRWDPPQLLLDRLPQKIDFPRLIETETPAIWSVYLPPELRLASANASRAAMSTVQIAEATAIAKQLNYLLDLPRASDDSDRVSILGELDESLTTAYDRAQQALDAEATFESANRRQRQLHERANRQWTALMQEKRAVQQRLNSMGIRPHAEPANNRLQTGKGPIGTDAWPSSVATPSDPPRNHAAFFVTEGKTLSVTLQSARDVDVLGGLGPAVLAGSSGWCIAMLLGTARGKTWRWILITAIVGLFWSMYLEPAPFGTVLMLAAAVGVIVEVLRRRRRTHLRFVPG